MESKLSDWLLELARGLEEGFYTVDENLLANLRDRADEAARMERRLEEQC